ncbi:hypothetical protein IJG66_01980 [Candidatus Saccharibacteria bacterium]|nr:hypothetical protein [Candidatus Saccharibacteria bacterium]
MKKVQDRPVGLVIFTVIALLVIAIIAYLAINWLEKDYQSRNRDAAHEQLVKDDWHHQDDRGNTNGDVFDYQVYLVDNGATDVKVAAYRNPDNGIQMWQLTWQKEWHNRPCTWSIYTENCEGIYNCYLECNVSDGQNFRTAADMGGEYVYDYSSAFAATANIYVEFRRVVELAEEASEDCPLAACQGGHYVTDDAISFAVWHDIGT